MKSILKFFRYLFIKTAGLYLWFWNRIFLSPDTRSTKNKKLKKEPPNHIVTKCFFTYPVLVFCTLLIHVNMISAQDYVDIMKVNYNISSFTKFKNSDVRTRINEIDLELTVPVVIKDNLNFITGAYFEAINILLFENNNPSINLYSISPKIGMQITHSQKWSGTYMLLPKIASDFKSINSDDFQLGGVVLFNYTKHENLKYKVGLYANKEFFGPWIVPLLGFYYHSPAKKIEANLTLPFFLDVNYSLASKIRLGVNFIGQTKSYHLSTLPVTGQDGYVARATSDVFGYVGIALPKNFALQVKFGHSFGRYYRVYNSSDKISLGLPLTFLGDSRQQVNTDIQDGWIFQTMLIYRYPLK